MAIERVTSEEKAAQKRKSADALDAKIHGNDSVSDASGVAGLQQLVGNRAVHRLLVQRSGGSFELDDETAKRINRVRGEGQPLEGTTQEQMGLAMDEDFSGVRVHTSPEADDLSRDLGAKAFTTGRDVFFREGAYDPNTSGGQELIAHELSHVVQQATGAVGSSGGGMRVSAPGDAFEQQADAVAKTATGAGAEHHVQRQEEEEELQMQLIEEEEEELIQPQAQQEGGVVQAQEEQPEEEL